MKTSPERSAIMRAVKSRNTSPELAVRKLLSAMGYRYRLHSRKLPGSPDIVFPGRKKAIFVHGCFWHGHACKRGARAPKTNTGYWASKIAGNMKRDRKNFTRLKLEGWRVLVLWECGLRDMEKSKGRIKRFLS